MGENLTKTINYEKIEMLISIKQLMHVGEVITLEVRNIKFPIRVRERVWSEVSKNNITNKEERKEEAEETVSESKSTIELELKKSQEGNQNVMEEVIMEDGIKNDRDGKECQKMLRVY